MTGRTLWYFLTLGGLCALLGFLATLTKERGFLAGLLLAYAIFAVSFIVAACRQNGKCASGSPYRHGGRM
ncbi:hypothetical protein GCM10009429_10710 [Dyella marensis]